MKKALLLLIAVLFATTSCIFDSPPAIVGNGKVVKEVRDVSGFTAINASAGLDVYLNQADRFSVVVEADENLHEVIVTELQGNELKVGVEGYNIRGAKARKVHVSLPDLRSLNVSSAADLRGESDFDCENLQLSVSSAGSIDLEVHATSISINASSSGAALLCGRAEHLDVNVSSAGSLNAYELEALGVRVNASSAGDARVYVTEELRAEASSAGSIRYRGAADLLHSQSGSGGSISKN